MREADMVGFSIASALKVENFNSSPVSQVKDPALVKQLISNLLCFSFAQQISEIHVLRLCI